MHGNSKSDRRGNARAQRSLTRKGQQTRALLLGAAQEVFREQGYYAASVSEISRRTGMSQGAFYQYFKNKEQVLLELNDFIVTSFWDKAQGVDGERSHFAERLESVVRLLLEHVRENYYYQRILGEFELIDSVGISYFDSLALFYRRFFRDAMNNGYLRSFDPNIMAYGLIGTASFHAMDWTPEEDVLDPDMLPTWVTRFIMHGVGGHADWPDESPLNPTVPEELPRVTSTYDERLTQGQLTARSIFRAAEKVFGQYGFNGTTVSDITRAADVAQGTFYVHFKSKRDLMEGLVKYLSREIRRELKMATQHFSDRRDVEQKGALAFYRFLKQHRHIYRVVAESETMGQEMGMWYYKKMAEGYRQGMAEGVQRGEIRDDLPVEFMVRSIMGFLHMIGLKWLVWNSSPSAEVPDQVQNEIGIFLIEGLDSR